MALTEDAYRAQITALWKALKPSSEDSHEAREFYFFAVQQMSHAHLLMLVSGSLNQTQPGFLPEERKWINEIIQMKWNTLTLSPSNNKDKQYTLVA